MNSPPAAPPRTKGRTVIFASTMGSVIEWYDFFLYATMAALVFNTEFFPSYDPLIGTLVAFGTFAAGFVTRPIGAVIFGHFGDRLGRKNILITTMLIMGLSTFAMGLLPTYADIGVAAPILLLVLRMLQGIGLGGEWGGAASLTFEHATAGRRGLFTSWPQNGVPLGLLLSTLAVNLATIPGPDALVSGTWRLPFLASIVLVVIALVVRLKISEPQAFQNVLDSDTRAKVPAIEVIRKYPKQVLIGAGARFSESITFNIYNAFMLTYVTTVLGLPNHVVLNGLLVASAVGFVIIPVAGYLSDRIGRRKVFGTGATVALLTAFPIFWLVNTEIVSLIWVGIVLGWALGACTMFGAEAAFFAELFPARVRYTGMSLIYQFGVLPSGAIAPALAVWLVATFESAIPVAIYVMVFALIALIALKVAKERAFDSLQTIDSDQHAASARGRSSARSSH